MMREHIYCFRGSVGFTDMVLIRQCIVVVVLLCKIGIGINVNIADIKTGMAYSGH